MSSLAVTVALATSVASIDWITGFLDGTGGNLAIQFEETIGDLVARYGRLPVSAVILIVAAIAGAILVPKTVALLRTIAEREPLSGHGGALFDEARRVVPTSFSELLVRTVQLSIAIVAALALVVVWGYADLVTNVRDSVASDIQDVIGLSLTMLLIALAFIGSDLLEQAIDRLGGRSDGITKHQQEIALRVGQVTLFVTLGAAILTLWSFDLTGLLVGAGFLGIVVGFAARETLGSLIAGFVLMFSRPFTIGDWVEIGDAEGVITDITMFNTRMQNVDAESLVIPNDVVSNSTIVNRSRKGRLQIRREVGIDYDNDPERATEVAIAAMEGVEDVIDSPSPQALPVRFEESSVVIELRFWIQNPRPPRKWSAIAGVLGDVKAAFEREGIDIPYPQRTLSVRGDGDVPAPVQTDGEHQDSAHATDDSSEAGVEESTNGERTDDETDGETAASDRSED